MSKKMIIALCSIGSIVLLSLVFYVACLNHVSANEVGVAYNSLGGKIVLQEHPGWYVTSPFVLVAHLGTLPMRVTIPSQAKVINTRLVRFKPEGLQEFIRLQGFGYELSSSLENTLLGYAFSGKQYSFMEILEEPNAPERK